MDRLEHYIINHKSEFDTQDVPDRVWRNIQRDLPEKRSPKRFSIRTLMSIAAFGALLFLAGIGVSSLFMNQTGPAMADVPPELVREFEEVEQYYDKQVQVKLNSLQDEEYKEDVLSDLEQLDEVYNELRNDMLDAQGMNNEKIVRSMIEHQRTKLQVLEKVLEKIDRKKATQNQKNYNNEDLDI